VKSWEKNNLVEKLGKLGYKQKLVERFLPEKHHETREKDKSDKTLNFQHRACSDIALWFQLFRTLFSPQSDWFGSYICLQVGKMEIHRTSSAHG